MHPYFLESKIEIQPYKCRKETSAVVVVTLSLMEITDIFLPYKSCRYLKKKKKRKTSHLYFKITDRPSYLLPIPVRYYYLIPFKSLVGNHM